VIEEKIATRVNLDIEGNQREVIDAKDRVVMRYDYDMLGNKIKQASMDAGSRWMLNDVSGKPILAWDSRNHVFSYRYDALRRPTETRVKGGDGPIPLDHLYEKILYGEGQSLNGKTDQELNLRGKPFVHYDTAGKVQFDEYDFKGNVLQSHRRLAKNHKETVQWDMADPDSALKSELFSIETAYDALNRISWNKTPDGSITTPTYNKANLLETVRVEQAGVTTPFVTDINYNEKGQRKDITYGNGITTTYDYDPLTFRLSHLQTHKPNGELLQDLGYACDPTGNITQIEDQARPTIFFDNMETRPVNDYTYDAIYRLIAANGREHIGQANVGVEDNWNDAPYMKQYSAGDPMVWRNYTQQYHYDAVGNILEMLHSANGGSWKREYAYETDNNRLQSTTVGTSTYNYPHHPQHGFIVGMPHLQAMEWNFRDELQAVAQQRRTNGGKPEKTYYVYDASGQRIRKITENAAAAGVEPTLKNERIYVGGIEIYREYTGNYARLERTTLHVMDDKQRIAMIETRNNINDGSPKPLIRYQLSNHLGTACLETNGEAGVISYEEYHPYGTTSYQAVDKNIKAAAKRYRYTGKERDEESGLYYHGARYYSAWLGRWVSCDPLLIIDGTCLYSYCRDNPLSYTDHSGQGANEANLGIKVEEKLKEFQVTANEARKVLGKTEMQRTPVNVLYQERITAEDKLTIPDQINITGNSVQQVKARHIDSERNALEAGRAIDIRKSVEQASSDLAATKTKEILSSDASAQVLQVIVDSDKGKSSSSVLMYRRVETKTVLEAMPVSEKRGVKGVTVTTLDRITKATSALERRISEGKSVNSEVSLGFMGTQELQELYEKAAAKFLKNGMRSTIRSTAESAATHGAGFALGVITNSIATEIAVPQDMPLSEEQKEIMSTAV
ncbi:MAG: RHS repeat-associated core domain-containing protein, partial [Deltaproteobacteria bacterium]